MEDVLNPSYWRQRLQNCGGELHRAVFNGSVDQFSPIQQRHRMYLKQHIGLTDSIIDCGCGYGRLVDFLPDEYRGEYLGVDISPELLELATLLHRNHHINFTERDLRNLGCFPDKWFDHALVCSVKPMVIRNCGQDVWDRMEKEINRVARKVHYLEFGEWD